jgi:hypothetical protein
MRAEQPEDIVWTNFGAGASAQLDLFFVANHSMDPGCGIRDKREQNSIEDEPRPYRLLPISMRGPLSPRTDRPRLHLETNSRGSGGDVSAPGREGNGWPSSTADRCFATLSAGLQP